MPRIDLIQLRGGTAAQWAAANPVLDLNEPGVESDTRRWKLGDGVSLWGDLPYEGEQWVEQYVGGAIQQHVDDPTPHPAYDDLPDFVLILENRMA